METKTIQQLASEVLANMEMKKRDNGEEFICLKDHNIEWHVDLCRTAHNDIMPNDYVYSAIHDALEYIEEAEGETEYQIRDYVIEGMFIQADIYNNDLLNWVASNLSFSEYCDRAISEYGYREFFLILQGANELFKTEVFYSVLDSLNKEIEKI